MQSSPRVSDETPIKYEVVSIPRQLPTTIDYLYIPPNKTMRAKLPKSTRDDHIHVPLNYSSK